MLKNGSMASFGNILKGRSKTFLIFLIIFMISPLTVIVLEYCIRISVVLCFENFVNVVDEPSTNGFIQHPYHPKTSSFPLPDVVHMT